MRPLATKYSGSTKYPHAPASRVQKTLGLASSPHLTFHATPSLSITLSLGVVRERSSLTKENGGRGCHSLPAAPYEKSNMLGSPGSTQNTFSPGFAASLFQSSEWWAARA